MNDIVEIIAAVVTIGVVAVLDCLPLAVTLTLGLCLKKIVYDNIMVRKLCACEDMGSATIICINKTCMLTFNQMVVTRFWQGKV